MDRLALPKRRPTDTDFLSPRRKYTPGIPPDPLPNWTTLPYEAKLPMFPGPKGAVVLYTTNLGEKIHISSMDLDFDLTDPNSMVMSNHYKTLHDPHLAPYLNTPTMRRLLCNGGFITQDGKVLCTLKEFNNYRHYLRKINLSLEKQRKLQETEDCLKDPCKKEQKMMRSDLREEKVKEIQERLKKKHEENKARLLRMIEEHEKRHQRLKQEQQDRVTQREAKYRAQIESRKKELQKRQQEDRRRKISILRRWMEEDRRFMTRAEERRRKRDLERQRKLEENWYIRKQAQEMRLDAEQRQRDKDEMERKRRIQKREQFIRRLQDRQKAIFLEMTEKRRSEREAKEAEYAQRFMEKMKIRRARYIRSRKKKRGKMTESERLQLRSNWVLERAILDSLSPTDYGVLNYAHGDQIDSTKELTFLELVDQELAKREARNQKQKELEATLSQLGLVDFKGAVFSEQVLRQTQSEMDQLAQQEARRAKGAVKETLADPQLGDLRGAILKCETESDMPRVESGITADRMVELGLSDFRGATILKKEKGHKFCSFADSSLTNMDDAAQRFVDVTLFTVSQIVMPAYFAYLEKNHPGLYWEYFRPTSPLPPEDNECGSSSGYSPSDSESEIDELLDIYAPKQRKSRKDSGVQPRGVRFSMIQELIDPQEREALQKRAFVHDFITEEDEEEGEETEEEAEEGSTPLSVRDSLTMLRQKSTSDTLLDAFTTMMQTLMDDVASGNMNVSQFARIVDYARKLVAMADTIDLTEVETAEMVDTSLVEVDRKKSSDTSLAGKGLSNSSLLAEKVVQETMDKLQEELMNQNEDVQKSSSSPRMRALSPESLTKLTDIVVQEAIRAASASLESLTSPESPVKSLVRQTSSQIASEFVTQTLTKVAQELEAEVEAKKQSATSLLVQDTIYAAKYDIEARLGTLGTLSYDQSYKLPSRLASDASQTSMLIRDTLSKVLREIEEDGTCGELYGKSASVVFVEELVRDTLQKCIHDVRNNFIASDNLINLTGAIVSSYSSLKSSGAFDPLLPQCTRSLEEIPSSESKIASVETLMVEALIKETLQKVERDVNSGNLSPSHLIALSNEIDPEKVLQSSFFPQKMSRTTVEAEACVSATLAKVMKDLSLEGSSSPNIATKVSTDDVFATKASSSASIMAEKYVQDMLEKMKEKILDDHPHMLTGNASGSQSSKTSIVAETLVSDALVKILKNIEIENASVGKRDEAVKIPPENVSIHGSNSNIKSDSFSRIGSNIMMHVSDDVLSNSKSSLMEKISSEIFEDADITVEAMQKIEDFGSFVDQSHEDFIPTIGSETVHFSPDVAEAGLSLLSVKEPEAVGIPHETAHRNSYRSLIHPDVSVVKGLSHDSEDSLRKKLLAASHHAMVHHSPSLSNSMQPRRASMNMHDAVPQPTVSRPNAVVSPLVQSRESSFNRPAHRLSQLQSETTTEKQSVLSLKPSMTTLVQSGTAHHPSGSGVKVSPLASFSSQGATNRRRSSMDKRKNEPTSVTSLKSTKSSKESLLSLKSLSGDRMPSTASKSSLQTLGKKGSKTSVENKSPASVSAVGTSRSKLNSSQKKISQSTTTVASHKTADRLKDRTVKPKRHSVARVSTSKTAHLPTPEILSNEESSIKPDEVDNKSNFLGMNSGIQIKRSTAMLSILNPEDTDDAEADRSHFVASDGVDKQDIDTKLSVNQSFGVSQYGVGQKPNVEEHSSYHRDEKDDTMTANVAESGRSGSKMSDISSSGDVIQEIKTQLEGENLIDHNDGSLQAHGEELDRPESVLTDDELREELRAAKKRSFTIKQSSSSTGKVVDNMTSRGGSRFLKKESKTRVSSKTSGNSVGGLGKSSHQSIDLTPRPSSGFKTDGPSPASPRTSGTIIGLAPKRSTSHIKPAHAVGSSATKSDSQSPLLKSSRSGPHVNTHMARSALRDHHALSASSLLEHELHDSPSDKSSTKSFVSAPGTLSFETFKASGKKSGGVTGSHTNIKE